MRCISETPCVTIRDRLAKRKIEHDKSANGKILKRQIRQLYISHGSRFAVSLREQNFRQSYRYPYLILTPTT